MYRDLKNKKYINIHSFLIVNANKINAYKHISRSAMDFKIAIFFLLSCVFVLTIFVYYIRIVLLTRHTNQFFLLNFTHLTKSVVSSFLVQAHTKCMQCNIDTKNFALYNMYTHTHIVNMHPIFVVLYHSNEKKKRTSFPFFFFQTRDLTTNI